MFFSSKKSRMPRPEEALPGRATPMRVGATHFVNGNRIVEPFPPGMARAMFGLGCFWGAERKFWQAPGVYATAVGYAAGLDHRRRRRIAGRSRAGGRGATPVRLPAATVPFLRAALSGQVRRSPRGRG